MTILYKSSSFYHALMAIVYGKNRHQHFQAVAEWVPDDAEVLDVCCADGKLKGYLSPSVHYKGVDHSPTFVKVGTQRGLDIRQFDLKTDPLPRCQVVVCQVSLFQFHPNVEAILAKLFDAAQQRLIISESVFSLTQSRWSWIAAIVAWGTRAEGTADSSFRFTPQTLAELFKPYEEDLRHRAEICDGRDWIYVLDKKLD